MRFGVLGPVVVLDEDRDAPVVVSAAMDRAVLAALLAHANRPVSPDALVDELWGDDPPRSAKKTLQTYVSHLRRVLTGRIRTLPGGYCLQVGDGELDALCFERSRRAGSLALLRGDPAAATTELGEALAWWRGDAYTGDVRGPRVAAEAVRLDDLRVSTLEAWYEARLARGEHRALCAELEAALVAHPLREVLWGTLMRALYAAGRQAEALRAFQRARAALAEVGVEPGPELCAVEAAVLSQSVEPASSLAAAPAASYVTTPSGLRIAYTTFGRGTRDVVFLGDVYLNIELLWEFDDLRVLVETLARDARVIVVQRRGTGLSDRGPDEVLAPPTGCVEDLDVVLDHLGVSQIDVVGWGHGGQVALAFAAARPDRVRRMAILNGYARLSKAPGYPAGLAPEALEAFALWVGRVWGTTRPLSPIVAPAVASDPALIARVSRIERLSASPGQAVALHQVLNDFDVRSVLASVRCPVLVVFLTSSVTGAARARWLAEHLPTAQFAERPGHFLPTGVDAASVGALVDEYLRSDQVPVQDRG